MKKSEALRDILFISLLSLVLYSIYLGSYPLLLPDEGRYSDVVREMLLHHNYVVPLYNGIPFIDKPPLFYWIETFFVRLIGLNEWGLRSWPMVIATLGCIATYLTGRQLFNRRTGWLSAIILGSSLFYFMMAHVADLDLTVAVFISFSLFSFMIAMERKKNQRWFFYSAYIFSALAILTKGLIGIAIPMMVVGLWIALLNRWRWLLRMHIISGLLIIAVICVPWFYEAQKQNPDFLHYFFYTQQFHRYLTQHFNSHHGIWFYPTIIILGTLPWTWFVLCAFTKKIKTIWKNRVEDKIVLLLLVWIISITLFFSIPASKTIGYILPVFPALALLTGTYIDNRLKSHYDRLAIVVPLVISLCIYPILMHILVTQRQHLGLSTSKPLAIFLKEHLTPKDSVVFYDNYYQDLALYLRHDVLLAGNFKQEKLKDNWREDFAEGLRNTQYQNHVLTLDELKKQWHSHKTMYAFVTDIELNSFVKTVKTPLFTLKHQQHLWLFSNKPLKNI